MVTRGPVHPRSLRSFVVQLLEAVRRDDVELFGNCTGLFGLVAGQCHQTLVGEIAFFAKRLVRDVFGDEFLHAGNGRHVLLLGIDEERTGHLVAAIGDGLVGGRDAIDGDVLDGRAGVDLDEVDRGL